MGATAQIHGRLTADVEVRFVGQNQTPIANFTLASDGRPFRKGDSAPTYFFSCKAIGRDAENLQKYTHKGDALVVFCDIQQEKWTDQQTGRERKRDVYKVNTYDFGAKAKRNQNRQPERAPDAPPMTTHQLADQLGQQHGMEDDEIPF